MRQYTHRLEKIGQRMSHRHPILGYLAVGCLVVVVGCTGRSPGSGENNVNANSPICGNGLHDVGEECDGADLNGQDCVSVGWSAGQLACDGSCIFDTSDCKVCDDGVVFGAEVCGDGLDNDCDLLPDCLDPDCEHDPACLCVHEICGDGQDNDCDGSIDCDDPDCSGAVDCGGEPCFAAGQSLSCDVWITSTWGPPHEGPGRTESYSCGGPSQEGPEYGGVFEPRDHAWLSGPRLATVTLYSHDANLDLFVLEADVTDDLVDGCDPGSCIANSFNPGQADDVVQFVAYPGRRYYIIIDTPDSSNSQLDYHLFCEALSLSD